MSGLRSTEARQDCELFELRDTHLFQLRRYSLRGSNGKREHCTSQTRTSTRRASENGPDQTGRQDYRPQHFRESVQRARIRKEKAEGQARDDYISHIGCLRIVIESNEGPAIRA